MDAARTPTAPPSHNRKTHAILPVCLIALLAVMVGGLVALAVFGGRDRETFHVTGDPLDVRFVGVQSAGTDDVLDAEGKKVDEMVAKSGKRPVAGRQDSSHMKRWFIFELSAAAHKVGFAERHAITDARSGIELRGPSEFDQRLLYLDKDRNYVETEIPRSYMGKRFFGLYSSSTPVEYVDLTLRFFHGPRKAAQYTFPGPFSYGKRVMIPSACLEVHQEKSGSLPRFSFSSSGPRLRYFEPFIYSTSGVRYGPTGFNVRTDYGKSVIVGSFTVSASSLNLDKIGCITINEQPREKTFHHIRVAYPDRPGKPPKQQR